jgi:outer membrane protein assembly factor BamB
MRAVILVLLASATAWPQDWPAWRGAGANGVSAERGLPVEWAPDKNVRWKAELPGPGNSTPVVWGGRVFLTQALDAGKRRAIFAFDRGTGKKLWQEEVPCATEETTHPKDNPPCSSSPVTDGRAVFAHFASAGVLACDLEGKKLWHRDLGPVLHKWGNGPSPVLYKNFVIVLQGPGVPTFLMALDKRTGETAWKTDLPGINSPVFGSWSTPVVVRVQSRDELILPLPGEKVGGEGEIKAFDPASGKELWRCAGLGTEVYAMPVVSADAGLVVAICGHNGPTMAVKTGGEGDVTATHRQWRTDGKTPQRVGSGVIHEGHLYLSDADGFAECIEAATGKLIWKERLGGKLWGSLLLAAGKIYVSSLEGQTFVLEASPTFKQVARNDLNETTYAAPAASNGALFLRTHRHLWCIASDK